LAVFTAFSTSIELTWLTMSNDGMGRDDNSAAGNGKKYETRNWCTALRPGAKRRSLTQPEVQTLRAVRRRPGTREASGLRVSLAPLPISTRPAESNCAQLVESGD
jgi:hypothetical protein